MRWAPSPRPFLRPGNGPSKAFPRRMRGRESGRAPARGSSRPHLQQRGALPPWSGLSQPAGLVLFRVLSRVMRFYRNGAEYRDGHTGVFGCDGIPPEGKGSPAVGLRGTPRGALPTPGARARTSLTRQPPAPRAQLIYSSPKLFQSNICRQVNLPVARHHPRGVEENFRSDRREEKQSLK